MKGRGGKGPPSADLLVCFPSRAHLTLMAPKPNICSPSRPSSEPTPRHRRRHHHHQQQPQNHHHMRNASNRGHASPLLWAKSKPSNSDISEPTSPKVTCAGQIKVKSKPNSCKSWQSVMEEIERLHNNRNKKKKHALGEALGFKKDVMQFLTCLRNIRFDFRCFGSFPSAEITSDDEEEDEEEEDETHHRNIQMGSKEETDESESSRTFSKWFMILQENNHQNREAIKPEEGKRGKTIGSYFNEEKLQGDGDDDDGPCAPPPPNALLLMRCRSAPAKSWLEEKEEEKKSESGDDDEEKEKEKKEEEEEKRKTEETERLHVVMRCGTADFSNFSSDIAKETWVVGGIKDMLSRSRSSKR